MFPLYQMDVVAHHLITEAVAAEETIDVIFIKVRLQLRLNLYRCFLLRDVFLVGDQVHPEPTEAQVRHDVTLAGERHRWSIGLFHKRPWLGVGRDTPLGLSRRCVSQVFVNVKLFNLRFYFSCMVLFLVSINRHCLRHE